MNRDKIVKSNKMSNKLVSLMLLYMFKNIKGIHVTYNYNITLKFIEVKH
jgi:hypothetical protein